LPSSFRPKPPSRKPIATPPAAPTAFGQATRLHDQAQLAEAERLYREVLTKEPRHVDALRNLGVLLHQRGQSAEGIALLKRARAAAPEDIRTQAHLGVVLRVSGAVTESLPHLEAALAAAPGDAFIADNLGKALLTLNRHAEAEAIYRRSIAQRPDRAETHSNLGNAIRRQGRSAEALDCFDRAVALKPDLADAHFNRGVVLKDLGHVAEARQAYERALEIDPRNRGALQNLANILRGLDELDAALALHERGLALAPDDADMLFGLASTLIQLERYDDALAALERALRAKPDFAAAANNLGNLLLKRGRFDEAIARYRAVLEADPQDVDALSNLGASLKAAERYPEAIEVYGQALALEPDRATLHFNLANAHNELDQIDDAIAHYETAIRLQPGYAEAMNAVSGMRLNRGQIRAAVDGFRAAAYAKAGYVVPASNSLFALNYDWEATPEQIFRASRELAPLFAQGPVRDRFDFPNDRDPERRLRVGFVSGDFKSHSCSFFIEPLLAGLDRTQVEVFAYSNVESPDPTTERIRRKTERWHDVSDRQNSRIAKLIADDRIDVLVDLAGHTAGARLAVFGQRAAPVQVTWLGYPNTTGLDAMDVRITDGWADPPGESDRLHTERLIRLERCFLCYGPPRTAPEVSPPPALNTGRVTFGCFNNANKINPAIAAVWARVLEAVPGSRLVLKAKQFRDRTTARETRAMLAAAGVPVDRLEYFQWIPGRETHLSSYATIDIALDPAPYNGTTTTMESLWMGVPTITLRGNRHAARVGYSILAALGEERLAAADPEGYVAIAAGLARDLPALAAFRSGARARMMHSPLCDYRGFAAAMTAALRAAWRGWCAEAPRL